jgi:hypothetical protein
MYNIARDVRLKINELKILYLASFRFFLFCIFLKNDFISLSKYL